MVLLQNRYVAGLLLHTSL